MAIILANLPDGENPLSIFDLAIQQGSGNGPPTNVLGVIAYDVALTDRRVLINNTNAPRCVNVYLPDVTNFGYAPVLIKDYAGVAVTYNIVISSLVGQLINNQVSYTMTDNYDSFQFYPNPTAGTWYT